LKKRRINKRRAKSVRGVRGRVEKRKIIKSEERRLEKARDPWY
jgi:hypothetical protein